MGAPRFADVIRPIRRVLGVVVAASAVLALLPVAGLVVIAQTTPGRVAGWAAVLALATVAAVVVAARAPARDGRHALAVALPAAGAVALYVLLRQYAPSGGSPAGPGLRSTFPGPLPYRPTALANLIPEADATRLGAGIFTRIDPWMSTAHARRVRRVMAEMYAEMGAVPATGELGGVANYAVAELIGGAYDSGHYYAYVPPHAAGERLGAIVFLHGNAGNFRVMAWAWKPFADRHKFAIILPSFGFGFWDAGGVEAVERARRHALATLPIDPGRVLLGGISDGGKGVTRSARAHPEHYRGLVYVSPTMLPDEVGSAAFVAGWKGRPALILQGADDHNVLQRDVDPAAALMKDEGVDVTYEVFPGEDHFLFFGRRDEVFARIERWMPGP